MFAKTLDEDFLIWNTVLESILYSEQSLAILTANSSLYSKSKFFFAIVIFPAFVLNHGKAVYGIRNSLRHGINAKYCMESRTKGNGEYSLSADAIRGRAAIPYNSLCELMPYQALRSWINKKTNRSSSFYFGGLYSLRASKLSKLRALCAYANQRFALAEQSAAFALMSKLLDANILDYHGLCPCGQATKRGNRKGCLFLLVDHQGLEPWTDRL